VPTTQNVRIIEYVEKTNENVAFENFPKSPNFTIDQRFEISASAKSAGIGPMAAKGSGFHVWSLSIKSKRTTGRTIEHTDVHEWLR